MTAFPNGRKRRLLIIALLNKSSHNGYFASGSFTYGSIPSPGRSRVLKGRVLAAFPYLPQLLSLLGFVDFYPQKFSISDDTNINIFLVYLNIKVHTFSWKQIFTRN